jgi:CCR4-NOT transcriptional complex subunit CAF120
MYAGGPGMNASQMSVPMGSPVVAPSMYGGSMGPGQMALGTGPPRQNSYGPSGPQAPPQPRLPPQQQQPNYGPPSNFAGQVYERAGGRGQPNIVQRAPPLAQPGAMPVMHGMQRSQSPSPGFYQPPPQGQYKPVGAPGGPRPGTPGRMPFQDQPF